MSSGFPLLKFQTDAKDKLVELIKKRLLGLEEDPVVLLKSPTGSGKTVVAGAVISELAEDDALDIAFVWLAPFKLQEQSLNTLRESLGSGQALTEKGQFASAKFIERNEVVFLNWASLNTADKKLIRGSEERAALKTICKATRDKGRQIVAIIDESQFASETDRSKEIIDTFGPSVIFEMSATPTIKSLDGKVEVKRQGVVDEGLIRKLVRVNEGVAEQGEKKGGLEDGDLLDLAVKKRDELAKLHKKAGVAVNPLLLIQIPDAKAGEEAIAEIETRLQEEHKISYTNGRLARWLADDATYGPNDPQLMDHDSKVEILIFKQAIAIGWDCPRAQVLLKIRDPGNDRFEIQTIGRVMRMPERRHYDDYPALNDAYVFHPHERYKEAEDFAIVTKAVKWRKGLQRPKLETKWMVRGETPYLEAKEADQIAKAALSKLGVDPKKSAAANKKALTAKKFDLKAKPDSKLAEQVIKGEDTNTKEIETLGDARITVPAKLVERQFYRLISAWVGVAGNPDLLAERLYAQAKQALDFDIPTTQAFIVKNAGELDQEFIAAVDKVSPRSERSLRIERSAEWQPPNPRLYNTEVGKETKYEAVNDLDHCAYEVCYLAANRSNPERQFEAWLSDDSDGKVSWWIKNGETSATDFSLIYELKGAKHSFFPDYVVKTSDGRIGLYETKAVEEAFGENTSEKERNEAKMAALREWVKEDPKKRDGAFVVLTTAGTLRFGRDTAPVGDDGLKMNDLLG